MISVAISIFNTEKYLKECIDSVINQSYKDLELILVDDGSTDNSPNICKDYASKDSRVKYIRTENRGVSSARNIGIESAKGEYLMFMDADDYLCLDALERMLRMIETNNVDVVCCECKSVYPDGKEYKYNRPTFKDEIVTETYFLQQVLSYNTLCAVWAKLYKMSLIKNFRFVEGLNRAEDIMFHATVFSQSKCKLLLSSERVIYYRILSNSISHRNDPNTQISRLKMYIKSLENLVLEHPNDTKKFLPYIAYNIVRNVFAIIELQGLFKHVNDWHKKTAQDNLPLCKDHINDGYIKFFKKVLELSGMELDLYATLYFMPTYIKNQLKRFVRSLK